MLHHVRDLHPVTGLNTWESGSDSKLSTQSARMIIINNAHSDPLEGSNLNATDDTSANVSSKEVVALPQRSTRCKRPAPDVIYVIIRSQESVAELKGRTSS